jgi:putative ATPase
MDLFSYSQEQELKRTAPLAERMKPNSFEELYGNEDMIGEGTLLRKAIAQDKVTSMILFGPPGSGKTSLARLISQATKSEFVQLNAVTSNVKEIREVIEKAETNLSFYQKKTILFLDEIHRFNKAQQDGLLPSVEKGVLILIGATTENPYFEVNGALLSRSLIFKLEPLSESSIQKIIRLAMTDHERGLGDFKLTLDSDAEEILLRFSGGDARKALNILELIAFTKTSSGTITADEILNTLQISTQSYDKKGDQHYDVISAFIKSVRGSDVQAALYYLARMIEGGESVDFIARRLIILASEDVGNADPQALILAVQGATGVRMIGMPEGRILLAQITTYLALAPKSNTSYEAIDMALDHVRAHGSEGVPIHLRDASYKGAKQFGHGKGYAYPHSFEDQWVNQQYLPDSLVGTDFYAPKKSGYEKNLYERFHQLKERKRLATE